MSLNLISKLFKKLRNAKDKNKEKLKIIAKNTFLVKGDIDLHTLEKLLEINLLNNRSITLKEFLEERGAKNGAFHDSFEYKNYVFIPQDINFQSIVIKRQCLNGKPLFYV